MYEQTLKAQDLSRRSSIRDWVRKKKSSTKGLSKEDPARSNLMGREDQSLNAWKSAHGAKIGIIVEG